MFSKFNAWRRAIASPKKAVPKDKRDDTVKVIMSVISLTRADPKVVLERLRENIENNRVGPKKDDDIDAIIEVNMNDHLY